MDRTRLARVVFWAIAIVLGAAQSWAVRHFVYSDGISYVDIGTAYAHGNWANAINAYWSPLFSWIIAIAFLVLHPSPYWEVPIVHLLMFLSYLAVLFSFEFFMKELILSQQGGEKGRSGMIPTPVLYVAGYCSVIFLALGVGTNIGNVSPDMITMALVLVLLALMLLIRRTGGSHRVFVLFGIACAVSYFAKEALMSTVVLCLLVILISRYKVGRSFTGPAIATACFMLFVLPFVAAISRKQGELTMGEAARLNYGWELDGATRYVHWQGEPYDIGKPKHPTLLAVSSPKTFLFPTPVGGTYPPWYDPSYWYAGIHPKLKIRSQLWALLANLSVAFNLFIRSPVILPAFALILLTGVRAWWRQLITLWPILLPTLMGIGLYCLVHVENRYIGANLLVLWMAILIAVRSHADWFKIWAPRIVILFAVVFLAIFSIRRHAGEVQSGFRDLVHGREKTGDLDYLLAERFRELGLRRGDKIAYIGAGINAAWARLDGLKVVAEVPLMYRRKPQLLAQAIHDIDDTTQIQAFWTADPNTRARVLQAFRDAGAKMVVAEGRFCGPLASRWPQVLTLDQQRLLDPTFKNEDFSELNTRYFPLAPLIMNSANE